MKKNIKSFLQHPKRVIALSLVVALALGVWGYKNINKTPTDLFTGDTSTDSATPTPTSNQNLTLGFLVGGRIKTVSVKAGDKVKKGQVLATLDSENVLGALEQARASYATAQANYQKVINGATGPTIDVARAVVNTAQVNLQGVTSQQNLLVKNAKTNLLNSNLVAKIKGDNSLTPPTISGTYNQDTEGIITIYVNQVGNGGYFTTSGMVTSTGKMSTVAPEPISNTGLFIEFPSIAYVGTTWDIVIPNTTASNYLENYNDYQSALQTKTQTIASAQATLDQANASLTALVTSARPEDVAAAQAQVNNALGVVQIAEGAYKNTVITAPADGSVVSVTITPGQIAMPNAPAIEFISK